MACRRRFSCNILLSLILLLASCASTKMMETWKDDHFKGPAFRKIMVVSLVKEPDSRQRLEDEFARQLNGRGVDSVTCYSCIPDIRNVTREEIIKAVARTGVQGVIVIELRKKEARIESIRTEGPPMRAAIGFDTYLSTAAPVYDDSPLIKRDEVVTMSARLFDAGTGGLVWFSTTETVDPRKATREISAYAKIILDALQREKLI